MCGHGAYGYGRFEEFTANFAHEQYAWGNPAFGCAYALADAFRENGWDMEAGGFLELSDLPIHNYQRGGESRPTGRRSVSYRSGWVKIQDRGVIPLLSIKVGCGEICGVSFDCVTDQNTGGPMVVVGPAVADYSSMLPFRASVQHSSLTHRICNERCPIAGTVALPHRSESIRSAKTSAWSASP